MEWDFTFYPHSFLLAGLCRPWQQQLVPFPICNLSSKQLRGRSSPSPLSTWVKNKPLSFFSASSSYFVHGGENEGMSAENLFPFRMRALVHSSIHLCMHKTNSAEAQTGWGCVCRVCTSPFVETAPRRHWKTSAFDPALPRCFTYTFNRYVHMLHMSYSLWSAKSWAYSFHTKSGTRCKLLAVFNYANEAG